MLMMWTVRTLSSIAAAGLCAVIGVVAQTIDPTTLEIRMTLPAVLALIGAVGGAMWWLIKDRQAVIDRLEKLEDGEQNQNKSIAELKVDIREDMDKGDKILEVVQELADRKG